MLLLIASLRPGIARAQGAVNHLYDKFQVGASAAVVILGSDFRIDNADGTAGTNIDQGRLGLPASTFAWAAGAAWRPGRRHELSLGYVNISRSGEKVLTDTVYFADTAFAAGIKINSKFSAPSLTLAWRFAFLAKEKTQVGFQLALGALFFDLGIDAVAGATTGGADTTIVQYSASRSLIGPTAALGLFGAFRAGDHWYFGVNGGALGATVDNISATSWVLGAEARYFFSNHWAASGAWSLSGIKITSEGDGNGWIDVNGSIKYNFQTIRLGVLYALH